MKKILIVSNSSIRNDSPSGNTFINLFGNNKFRLNQIFCSEVLPDEKICDDYLKITEKLLIKKIYGISKEKLIDIKEEDNYKVKLKKIKKLRFPILFFIREIIWKIFNKNNKKVEEFIKDLNPDIIFSTPHSSVYLYDLCEFINKKLNKKIIMYFTDDVYSYSTLEYSIFSLLHKIWIRKKIKKLDKYCSLIYTITEEQKEEFEKILKVPIKVLQKGGEFKKINLKQSIIEPIRLLYAGGLYLGRDKILKEIYKTIKEINKEKVKIILEIYSQHMPEKQDLCLFDDKENSFFKGKADSKGIKKAYEECDVCLHVESFEKRQRKITRLSFSTKIVDCLESGRMILACGGEENSGLKYLKKENAALVAFNLKDLRNNIIRISKENEIIKDYSKKAWELGKREHQIIKIQNMIEEDFIKYNS